MKYRPDVQSRGYYNLLVIWETVVNHDNHYPNSERVFGSLRFDNDDLGNKALDLWKNSIQNMNDINEGIKI